MLNIFVGREPCLLDLRLEYKNSEINSNKFYEISLIKKDLGFHTLTKWGRVGTNGQSKTIYAGTSIDQAWMAAHEVYTKRIAKGYKIKRNSFNQDYDAPISKQQASRFLNLIA